MFIMFNNFREGIGFFPKILIVLFLFILIRLLNDKTKIEDNDGSVIEINKLLRNQDMFIM